MEQDDKNENGPQPGERPEESRANGPRASDAPAGDPLGGMVPPRSAAEKDKLKGKDGSGSSGPDADARAEEVAAEFEDALGGADGHTVVTDAIQARNAFVGSTLSFENLFVGGDVGKRGGEHVVTSIDITKAVAEAEATFVEPVFLPGLAKVVSADRVAVLAGPGGGKESAGGAALRRAGCATIRQLPGDLQVAGIVDAAVKLASDCKATGILIDGIDAETLLALGGFELRRLKSALAEHGSALILTIGDERAVHGLDAGLPVVAAHTSPDFAFAVADSHAAQAQAGPEEGERIHAALELLAPPVPPRVAVAIVAAALEHRARSATELAARFQQGTTDDALAPWLRRHRSAHALASVAAAVTLEGAPLGDVDGAASRLELYLEPPTAEGGGSASRGRFTIEDRHWPEGVLTVARERFGTHYGHPETDVPRFCPPHDRGRALATIWNTLGPAFREPYLIWLQEQAAHRASPVRVGAAMSAGFLFNIDALIAERDLLRPWALDGRGSHRSCAALAVSAAAVFGDDATAARALVKNWGTTSDERLRRVAVLAYGGLLGAWDPGAAAAAHLWRIGEETPPLQPMADAGLATLTAAGAGATRARATVVGMLLGQLEDRRSRPRVYGVVPLIARELTRTNPNARASVRALAEDDDGSARAGYAALLARAFDAPNPGFRSACRALGHLLAAASRGRLDDAWLEGLVREMRDDARPRGREAALGMQLQRALRAERRRQSAAAEAAARLLSLFFRPTIPPGGTPA